MAVVTFIAGENLGKGTPVAVNPAGAAYKCCPTDVHTKNLAGVTLAAAMTSEQVRVQCDDMTEEIYTDLVPGEKYYTGMSSGTISSGSVDFLNALEASSFTKANLNLIGTALTATRLNVEKTNPTVVYSGADWL